MWVLAWWVANSAEQESCEVGWVVGSRGRNASRRLGGDGPRRRWSGLQATRGLGSVACAVARAARHETAAAAPGLASSNLAAVEGAEQNGNGTEGARRIGELAFVVECNTLQLCSVFFQLLLVIAALRGCKYEGVSVFALPVPDRALSPRP